MKRFEIEDFAYQGSTGIIYRGMDSSTGHQVAIRRFFISEQGEVGLDKEKANRFSELAENLSKLEHPALRSIIAGGADPVDGVPYLVTQWVDGDPLSLVLGNNDMDPPLVVDLIRFALELSIAASEVIGEEAVWIDTSLKSIVVGNDSSGRGFTFSICPFKILGMKENGKRLTSLISLVEALCGGKSKYFGNQPDQGLGDWIKKVKASPRLPLHEALSSLAESTGQQPPPSEEEIIEKVILSPPARFSPKLKYAIIGFAIVSLIIALQLPTVFAVRETEAVPETKEGRTAEVSESGHRFYSPDDISILEQMDTGTRVRIRGQLVGTQFSNSKKSLYLFFSEPYRDGQIRGVVHERDFQDEYKLATFEKFVGSTIELDGHYIRDSSKNPLLVKIDGLEDISKRD